VLTTTTRKLSLSFVLLFAVTILCERSDAANIVFIGSGEGQSAAKSKLEIAGQFYGLELREVAAGTPNDRIVLSRVVDKATVAVAIGANTLGQVDREVILQSLHKASGSVPLLILGITPEAKPELLKVWSNGAVIGCRHTESRGQLAYRIEHVAGVTGELSDVALPFTGTSADYLALSGTKRNEAQIVEAVEAGGRVAPVFVETAVGQTPVFLESRLNSSTDDFAEIAPAMLFAKYSAGERGWHALHHYANLTIDDPWLREPYGFVDYVELLSEMEKHRFHTTIAFIPWNYDRSQPGVVSLFREHPGKLSIAIHGDNHDHKEFTDYRMKSLALQVIDLRQALARMERFRELTQIPYDKVMIFPHSIAPEQTLAALKENGYLATVNSSNVPMGAVQPADSLFDLRAATLAYGGLLSLRRYSVEGPLSPEFVPVNLFLDNPLLFYCHQEFFASGIGAFDTKADAVNRIEPGVRWRSLGEIVRHMYLVKQRDDGDVDVLSFTATVNLENPSVKDAVFHVRKEEQERPLEVTVDRQQWPYSFEGGYVEMQIPLAAGQARAVSITHRATGDLRATAIERRSARVYFLRRASDFRDIALARFASGLWFIRFYQRHGEPLKLLAASGFLMMLGLLAGLWRVRIMLRNRRQRPSEAMVTR
jgi:hypothetical protein